jgi:hypothetical protein
MSPEGPYINTAGWSSVPMFIVTDYREQVIYVTVQQGQQRSEGTPHINLRDARQWMKDNGYELRTNHAPKG